MTRKKRSKFAHTAGFLLQGGQVLVKRKAIIQEEPDKTIIIISCEKKLILNIEQNNFPRSVARSLYDLNLFTSQVKYTTLMNWVHTCNKYLAFVKLFRRRFICPRHG
jgi:hypothetical protein